METDKQDSLELEQSRLALLVIEDVPVAKYPKTRRNNT